MFKDKPIVPSAVAVAVEKVEAEEEEALPVDAVYYFLKGDDASKEKLRHLLGRADTFRKTARIEFQRAAGLEERDTGWVLHEELGERWNFDKFAESDANP